MPTHQPSPRERPTRPALPPTRREATRAPRDAPRAHRAGAVLLVGLLVALVAGCGENAATGTGPGTAETSSGVVHVASDAPIDPVSPAPAPELPVTVRSVDGVDVEIDDVSRILAVDLYGTLAETVFSLGLGDNVVGRDTSTGFAEAASLPLVTVGGHSLSAEAVLDLDPSVVLTDTTIGPPEVLAQLREAGIPVVFFDPTRTIDGIGDQIEAVATALGVADAGRELAARTTADIAAATADSASTFADGAAPRVAFLYLRGSAVALLGGPGSGADELVTAIGGVDAGTAVGLERPFTQITSEALVGAAPDVLLLLDGGLASVDGIDGLLAVPGIAQTPAGAHRAVVTVTDSGLLTFGPRTAATLRALAAAVADAIPAEDDA